LALHHDAISVGGTLQYEEGYRLLCTKTGLIYIKQPKAFNQALSGSHDIGAQSWLRLSLASPRPHKVRR